MSTEHFRLFLLLNLITILAAQCDIQDLEVNPDPVAPSSQLIVSWMCNQNRNTFQISHQLTNRDQCDTGDDGQDSAFKSQQTGWSLWNRIQLGNGEYAHSESISGLLPYSTYSFTVQSRRQRSSNYELSVPRTQSSTTSEAAPSAPPTGYIYGRYETSLEFEWDEILCGFRHGAITYEYEIRNEGGQPVGGASFEPMTFTAGRPGVRVTGLNCGVIYSLRVSGKTSAGTGPKNDTGTATLAKAPGVVRQLGASSVTATHIMLTWMEPIDKGCPVIDTYVVTFNGTSNLQQLNDCNNFPQHTGTNISNMLSYDLAVKPHHTYTITVRATGRPEINMPVTASSLQTAPSSSPRNLTLTGSTSSSLNFSWSEIPCSDRNGDIMGYTYQLITANDNTLISENEVTKTEVTISDLTPGTSYVFSVAARTISGINGKGPSQNISIQTMTRPQTSSSPGDYVMITTKSTEVSSATVRTEGFSTDGQITDNGTDFPLAVVAGVIAVVFILVLAMVVFIFVKRRRKKSEDDVPLEMTEKPNPAKQECSFADNEGVQNGHHINPDLSEMLEDENTPPTQAIMEKEPPKSPEPKTASKPNLKLKSKPKKVKPINVESLSEYIAKQKARQSEGFKVEFDDIPSGQQYPWDESQKEKNLNKNRYVNIATYDHSRVVLKKLEGDPDSDYFNASYVKGYRDKLYIACQGPNKSAMGEIWRMAWEQNSAQIVMLTNMVERGKRKCEQYWPDVNEPFIFPPMTVTHKQTQEYADFVIRDFVLEKIGEKEPREIRQFHFVSWPDMGVPEYPTPIINFLRLVNAYQPKRMGLPIIHCSAGVGRTGTFITVDSMLEMAKAEGKVDINGAVRKLREDRINMVQTREQYEFIYETVQEAVICGDTGILVTNLRQGFNELQSSVNKRTGNTKLVDQFQILDSLTVVPTEREFKSGYAPENVNKNRFPNRVPCERVRPYLTTPTGGGSSDYINAAFLDGYVRKDEYIVTQMPLPDIIEDFWRMVFQYKSTSIVMLNQMSHSDPTLGVYWIDSGILQLTYLTIEFQSSKKYMEDVLGRIFKVYPNDNPEDFITVQQFQFLAWPVGQETPNSAAPLIAMIAIMDIWQQKQQKIAVGMRPITVHCIDGIGVSGVFCALVSMLNRMKAVKTVDVFQSVKRLRMGRPGMVETLEQYKFLFEAAEVRLEEYKIYENFR